MENQGGPKTTNPVGNGQNRGRFGAASSLQTKTPTRSVNIAAVTPQPRENGVRKGNGQNSVSRSNEVSPIPVSNTPKTSNTYDQRTTVSPTPQKPAAVAARVAARYNSIPHPTPQKNRSAITNAAQYNVQREPAIRSRSSWYLSSAARP